MNEAQAVIREAGLFRLAAGEEIKGLLLEVPPPLPTWLTDAMIDGMPIVIRLADTAAAEREAQP